MASGPITSWQIDRETVETVADFMFLAANIINLISILVLEKTLESLLDCKEIQPVHPKGNPY